MERNNMLVGRLVLAGNLIAPLFAQAQVTYAPWIVKALYCRESDDRVVFQVSAGFTITNVSTVPAIVFRGANETGFRIEEIENNRVVQSRTFRRDPDQLSLGFWKGASPDPKMFDVLSPGKTVRSAARVRTLPVSSGPNDNSGVVRPGGQYRLYLFVDHSAGGTQPNPPADRWPAVGLLVNGTVETQPIMLEIPSEKDIGRCPPPRYRM